MSKLERLTLSGNRTGEAGTRTLLASSSLAKLTPGPVTCPYLVARRPLIHRNHACKVRSSKFR